MGVFLLFLENGENAFEFYNNRKSNVLFSKNKGDVFGMNNIRDNKLCIKICTKFHVKICMTIHVI